MPPKKKTPAKRTRQKKQLDTEKLSQRELAHILGLEKTTPAYWASKGCPRNPDKSFSLRAVYHWRIKLIGEQTAKAKRDADSELERQRSIKTKILEIELEEKRGGTISVVKANRLFASFISTGRAILQGLPDRLAMLVPDEFKPIVREECVTGIEDGLRTMARAGEEINASRLS